MGRKITRCARASRLSKQKLAIKTAPVATYDNDGVYCHDPCANQLGDPHIQAWMEELEAEAVCHESEEDPVVYENQMGDPKVQEELVECACTNPVASEDNGEMFMKWLQSTDNENMYDSEKEINESYLAWQQEESFRNELAKYESASL